MPTKRPEYEAMTADELGLHRNALKRAYEAERDASTAIYHRKVTDERDRDMERAHGMPEGTIHTLAAPPPAVMGAEGS